MGITIGAPAEHGFDEPLALLSDCHRRIEKFLGALIKIMDRNGDAALAGEYRDAAERALTYFKNAAPRHTEDEEVSLFPLMRASGDPRAQTALAAIDALEKDHLRATLGHEEVEFWYRRWLDNEPLAAWQRIRLRSVLEELEALYCRHIQVEDSQIFPLAAELLSTEKIAKLGHEMATRRGVLKHAAITPS